jgi:hypothetical protein
MGLREPRHLKHDNVRSNKHGNNGVCVLWNGIIVPGWKLMGWLKDTEKMGEGVVLVSCCTLFCMFAYSALYGAMAASTWNLNLRHLCINYQLRHLPSGSRSLRGLLIVWGFSTVNLLVNLRLFNSSLEDHTLSTVKCIASAAPLFFF